MSTDAKPLRADARRNRERVLDAAVQAFAQGGTDVTLDAIAKAAGVGIGTLYRHFPTREALVEAVYRNELARLCDSATELLATLAPDRAMRAWMDHFVGFMTTKHGMADALKAVIAAGGNPYEQSMTLLVGALDRLLHAGAAAGTLRADVQGKDLLIGLSGVTLAAGEPERRETADRVLDLIMDGLRYRD